MADEEGDWFKRNPEPQSSATRDELTLWNFPVAKADLAPAHEEAIRRFAGPAYIASSPENPAMEFNVRGHASATGAERANQALAQRRADSVGAVLTEMGLTPVVIESAGSLEPADRGTSGQALARNRRVVVNGFRRTYEVVSEASPKPPPRMGQDSAKFTAPVRLKINLPLRTLQTPRVLIAASMIGELTVAIKGKIDPVDAGVTTSSGNVSVLTDEFAQELARNIDAKLGLAEGTGTGPPSIKVGIEAEEWFLLPKVYYQQGPYLIYFNFKAIVARLPIIEFRGAQVFMEFSGSFRFELGPSSSTVSTYRSTTDPGPDVKGTVAEYIPVDGGALLIAQTITEAGKQATPLAQTEIEKVVLNLATRDGAASRVAAIALGDDGEAGFRQMRLDWETRVSPRAKAAWAGGSNQVDALLLDPLKTEAEREQRKNTWKTKYGSGQPKPDFGFVREGVFVKLKGYDDDQGDLKDLIEAL